MKIGTLSLVVGDERCNAKCPFCISKMTAKPPAGDGPDLNYNRLNHALQFAQMSGVTTVLLTGKGEPTLFPDQISHYLRFMHDKRSGGNHSLFPFIELQTNGFLLEHDSANLEAWHKLGMTTISVSIADIIPENNARLMGRKTVGSTARFIQRLHRFGFSVRINLTLMHGGVECWDQLLDVIRWCKQHQVEQFTFRHVTLAYCQYESHPMAKTVSKWVLRNQLKDTQLQGIRDGFNGYGTKLLELPHGAIIKDIMGQNVCFNNCVTPPEGEEVRQIIFFPTGSIRYDWVHPGAVLL